MTKIVTIKGVEWEIADGFVPPVAPLDTLADRMANAVIAGIYTNAREAAKKNVVEYAGHETKFEDRRNTQVGNFTRKIIKTLKERGYDKAGNSLK
jgi:hypothetical protein